MPVSEEVLLTKKPEEKSQQMCAISKNGLTLFGFHLSWVVIALIAILVYFYLNKNGMLSERVSEIISSASSDSAPSPPTGPIMTGGFSKILAANRGQMRQMMGH